MTNKIPERKFLLFYLSATFLLYLIIGMQGFDMCDEGWVLTGFQQIFNDPKSVQYLFLYYLSTFVGGVWNCLFGEGGILAFRVLAALSMTVSSYVIYKILRPYVPRSCMAAGTFWIFLCSDYGIMVFYHDNLTTLLSACASYFLLRSLLLDKPGMMFLCGIIVGVNVFARLPNASLVMLFSMVIPYYLVCRNGRMAVSMFINACLGFAAGVAAVSLLMYSFGHFGIFIDAINDGFSAVDDGQSTHNLGRMLLVYLDNYSEVAINIVLVFTLPVLFLIFRHRLPARLSSGIGRTILVLVTCAVYLFMVSKTSNNTFTLYSVATVACVVTLLKKPAGTGLWYLSLIIMIVMYFMPLGSDYGIANVGFHCIWIAAPFSAGFLHGVWLRLRGEGRMSAFPAVLFLIFLLLVFKRGTVNIASQCYFDEGYRWKKTSLIDSPLATTLTTEKNSRMLSPMLHELSKYVKEDDCLLCFQNIATVHFLTKTRPYLYNPWVWTYDPTNMERKFEEVERTNKRLPVVVRDKSMLPKWYEYYPDWNNSNATESYLHKNKKIVLINRFLSEHGYKVVWENEVFQILTPPSPVKKKNL